MGIQYKLIDGMKLTDQKVNKLKIKRLSKIFKCLRVYLRNFKTSRDLKLIFLLDYLKNKVPPSQCQIPIKKS